MQNTQESSPGIPLTDKGSASTQANDLRTPWLLARRPFTGLILVILGTAAFWAIAFSLQTNGSIVQLDVPFANTIHRAALQGQPFVREIMIFGYYLGEHVIFLIGAGLAIYFLRKRFWPELTMVVVAWAGEGLLWIILSRTFDRPRPIFDVPVWHQMTSPGFPSGHAISAVMCYGLVAYLLVPKIASSFWKAVVIILAVLAILLIGFSRIYIGDHYLTDVLAGIALGIAWSGLVYTSVELIFKKRIKQDVKER